MYVPLTQDGKILITCPYCFYRFAHDEVCFRLESVFDDDELDPTGEGRDENAIQKDSRFPEATRKEHYRQFQERSRFKKGPSKAYTNWWDSFSESTEVASRESDKQLGFHPYDRPVMPIGQMKNVKTTTIAGPFTNGDTTPREFVLKATDLFGKETDRRVCPHCHNPLHGNYGMYPMHFISIIGAHGAGKTVYISQLLTKLNIYTSKAEVTANGHGCGAATWDYIVNNTCAMNQPLPKGTEPKVFVQPMLYMLSSYSEKGTNTNMIVIYDISGENCEGQGFEQDAMKGFGSFIFHSDALMIFVAPNQIVQRSTEKSAASVGTDTVVNNIASAFQTEISKRNEKKMIKIPVAICVSQGDDEQIRKTVLDSAGIEAVRDVNTPRKFDSVDYNPVQAQLKTYFERAQYPLVSALKNYYANYNFFIFTALGCGTKTIEVDGIVKKVLSNNPSPKRIEEPFMWILHKLGYIGTNAPINEPPHHEPDPWLCTKGHGEVAGTSNHCPKCHKGPDGIKVPKKERIG